MEKKHLLTVVIMVLVTNLIAQNYYELTSDATILYNAKKYNESAIKWDKAFSVHKGFSNDYYNAACSNALLGNNDKAIDYLRKAVEYGWTDIDWLKNDSDFTALRNTEKWNKLVKEIPIIQKKGLNRLNIELKERLENLRMQDQLIRLLLPDAEQRFGRESKEYKWFRNVLMTRNDSLVLAETMNIINNKGWVGISEVGELANQTLWLVIQHAPLNIQQKYFPLLKTSVEAGESKGHYLAFLEDRILMRQGKKQHYGTQSLWNKDLQKNIIYPIDKPDKVNKLRKEVGLETIEDYARNNGFIYNQE